MDIKEWRPIGHWVEVFGLNLTERDIKWFSDLCVIFATDERVEAGTGYAKVWNEGHERAIKLFDPDVPRLVAAALANVEDEPAKFLRATHGIGHIPWPLEQQSSLDDWNAWGSPNLSSTQERYALNVYDAFESSFHNGYNDVFGPDYRDPGLRLFAAGIARARHPKKRKSVKKRSLSHKRSSSHSTT